MDKKELVSKASRGLIRDYYNTQAKIGNNKDALALLPDFNRENALAMVREDYAVQTAVNKLVDKTLENGYYFYPDDNKSNQDEFDKLVVKRARIKREIRQWLFQLYGYQNVFIENVKDGNSKIKELHTLETTQTEPLVDIHGEVLGYIQRLPNADGKEQADAPTWSPEEVTHIRLNYMTTNVWGDLELKAIYTSVLIKKYIMAYFGWKYGTNQLRPLFAIKEADEDSVKDFLAYWKKVQNDITKPLIFDGEIEKMLMNDATMETSLIKVMQTMDENIYSNMHVPPIASNETGNSNRSSADKQEEMMVVRIRAVQQAIEEAMKYDLFPKIGFPKMNMKFNLPLKRDFQRVLENAERMKNIGFKPEVIENYLKENGFFKENKLLDKNMFQVQTKSEDMYASRKRKNEDDTSKNIGTGADSTTRQDQLVAKGESIKDRFNKYPYTF